MDLRNSSKESKIKDAINEITKASTAHGLSHLSRTNRFFLKVMWLFLTLLSVCACSYFVSLEVLDFFQFNTETKIKIIREQQADFPTISFCHIYGKFRIFNFNVSRCYLNIDNTCQSNWQFFISTFSDPIYGKCYRFNGNNQKLKLSLPGLIYGLRLDLSINPMANVTLNELIVHIHNRSDNPSSLFNHGYSLSAGTRNYFSLQRIFYKSLSFRYSDCLKDVSEFKMNKTLINIILSKNKTYMQNDCMSLCTYLKIIELSNCSCGSVAKLDFFLEECFFSNKINCISIFIREFQKKNVNDICTEYCPLECDSMVFTITPYTVAALGSGVIYPQNTNLSFESYPGFDKFESVRENFFSIYVFYESLKYTLIMQEASLLLGDLISNIGGLMGVFIGLSFLSFFELIEIIFEIIFISVETTKEICQIN